LTRGGPPPRARPYQAPGRHGGGDRLPCSSSADGSADWCWSTAYPITMFDEAGKQKVRSRIQSSCLRRPRRPDRPCNCRARRRRDLGARRMHEP